MDEKGLLIRGFAKPNKSWLGRQEFEVASAKDRIKG